MKIQVYIQKIRAALTKLFMPISCKLGLSQNPEARFPGSARGKIEISSDYDSPLTDDVLHDFEG